MRAFDFSPLLRSSVGFDHVNRLFELANRIDDAAAAYPPYNIEKHGEDAYRITMAVAGFGEEDLDITAQDRVVVITGRMRREDNGVQYLHRGIAGRPFERRFELADHIKVTGASLVNGLLHVELVREVPEAMRPRTIQIERKQPEQPKVIDQKAA